MVDGERAVLLDEAIGPLRELTHQSVAPPLRHVAVVVEPSACNQMSFIRNHEKPVFGNHATIHVESVHDLVSNHDTQIAVCHVSNKRKHS